MRGFSKVLIEVSWDTAEHQAKSTNKRLQSNAAQISPKEQHQK